ncbi:MAG: gliding motility-associated protein GldE [Chitinophagaceae bacterium]|nr:gliding motility-associated protein GldE [Chitinophagaceae bacterium]
MDTLSDTAFSTFIHSGFLFFLAAFTQEMTYVSLAFFILLFLIFTISGSEVALFSLKKQDINILKTKQLASAKRIVSLLEEPKEVYASLLIAGTFLSICLIILGNFILDQYVSITLKNPMATLLVKAFIIAFVLIFFGKMLPKVCASQNPLRFAYGSSWLIQGLHALLYKISRKAVGLADQIGKQAGVRNKQSENIQEMDEVIDSGNDDDVSPEEKNIMKGVIKFGNITVKQIMKSRLDVCAVPYESNFGELIQKVEELHYSRLPVMRNNSLDEIAGILYTKDLIPYLNENEDFNWHSLIRQPYFVPETKLIEDLLKEFQQKRIHFAFVVDEFGGTSGIVTMEDILEEVIGDIRDEFDEDEPVNKKLDENNYIFEGKTMIHDACKIMNLPPDTFDAVRGESESLAGLILELAGEFPEVNTVITCGDFEFTVLQSGPNRIQTVKVTIKPSLAE